MIPSIFVFAHYMLHAAWPSFQDFMWYLDGDCFRC